MEAATARRSASSRATRSLAEAFRLATSYDTPLVARELAHATLGMIGGQYLDITGTAPDEATLHRLKTGCLFEAAVALALWVARVPEGAQSRGGRSAPSSGCSSRSSTTSSTATATSSRTASTARGVSPTSRPTARARALGSIDADTSVLRDIVDGLAVRTA